MMDKVPALANAWTHHSNACEGALPGTHSSPSRVLLRRDLVDLSLELLVLLVARRHRTLFGVFRVHADCVDDAVWTAAAR